ncbi:MAG: hypothetical protein ABIV63_05270 [Caldimonas sp.]
MIRNSEWLVMDARGFSTEADAYEFGRKLRSDIEIASVSTRLGIDAGREVVPEICGRLVMKDRIGNEIQATGRPNVHGLDVLRDDINVRFFDFSAAATALATPDPFLAMVPKLHALQIPAPDRTSAVILLLNHALMRPEAIVRAVLAFAAIEMLARQDLSRETHRPSLSESSECSMRSATCHETERQRDAICPSVHQLTVRDGVRRLLDALDLGHLKGEWNALHDKNDAFVCEPARWFSSDSEDLATRAVNICGQILFKSMVSKCQQWRNLPRSFTRRVSRAEVASLPPSPAP